MQAFKRRSMYGVLVTAGILSLASCGGGGGSATTNANTNTTAAATAISGTAAYGSAFAGATVTVTDAAGVQRSATAAPDGSFTVDVTGLAAPFVITATGTVGGVTSTFVSLQADAVKAGETRTVNVTPLTTAIAALLADSGNPLDLTDTATLKAKANAADIKKAADALRAVLANVVSASGGDTAFDPIATPFKADHTGLDGVLDAVKVTVADSGVVLTNAFAPMAESAADAASVLLSKASLSTPPAALPAPAMTASSIAGILETWRAQLDACFALSADNRVTVAGGTVTAVKGACANISGFDPAYKSNGYTLLQRYGDLLSDPAMTGAKFSTPEVLTLVKSDAGEDLAIFRLSYKRSDGDSNHVVDVAQRKFTSTATDSGWRVVGNQRDYDAAVESRFDRMTDMKTGKVQYRSGLRLYFNPLGPNASDVNAVRVTGPGLPSAGVVLGRSTALGTADYLQIQNKTGTLTYSSSNTRTSSAFILSVANADKSAVDWQGTNSNWATTPLAEFASIKPFSRYKFEVFRNTTDTAPKTVFYARMTAAPVAPSFGGALQWNMLNAASKAYLDPSNAEKAAALASATIAWTRNPLAAPVEHINLFGSSSTVRILAQKAGIKQSETSAVVSTGALGSSFGTAATTATIPALNVAGNYREIALRTRNSADVRQYDTWFYQN